MLESTINQLSGRSLVLSVTTPRKIGQLSSKSYSFGQNLRSLWYTLYNVLLKHVHTQIICDNKVFKQAAGFQNLEKAKKCEDELRFLQSNEI